MKVLKIGLAGLLVLLPVDALAGIFELSGAFSYNDTYYTSTTYTWERRWGASFGYHITEMSEIELGIQDVYTVTYIPGYQDTTFHDQIYSIDWVQALTGKNFPIQPYVKVGIGQLNREASGSYVNGVQPPAIVDEVTGILGAGFRVYLTRQFALRAEGTTYLAGGNIGTWQQNFATTFGVSIYF